MSLEREPEWIWASAVGQDSHRFLSPDEKEKQPRKKLVLAGIELAGETALSGNSDADVVLHALTNAISGLTGSNILGDKADKMCLEEGITDSSAYLLEALRDLDVWRISHVSISIECRRPRLAAWIGKMKNNLAALLQISVDMVGITATSGEELTAFGKGEGIQAICIVSGYRPNKINS